MTGSNPLAKTIGTGGVSLCNPDQLVGALLEFAICQNGSLQVAVP